MSRWTAGWSARSTVYTATTSNSFGPRITTNPVGIPPVRLSMRRQLISIPPFGGSSTRSQGPGEVGIPSVAWTDNFPTDGSLQEVVGVVNIDCREIPALRQNSVVALAAEVLHRILEVCHICVSVCRYARALVGAVLTIGFRRRLSARWPAALAFSLASAHLGRLAPPEVELGFIR